MTSSTTSEVPSRTFESHNPVENDSEQEHPIAAGFKRFTIVGRVVLFLFVPFVMGILGMIQAYLDPKNKEKESRIDFDRDFLFPFIMTLVIVIVIGFQTSGYRKKPAPVIAWPKKIIKRKVKTVYVDDDGNPVDDIHEHENDGPLTSEARTKKEN